MVTTQTQAMLSSTFEEEALPSYDPEEFYPIHPGDRIKSRYHVIGKVGYGANSTVWFCRDLQNGMYVVAKVYLRTPLGWTNREKATYEHLATLTTTHPGCHNIRQALDIFDIVRANGDVHVCLVHSPLQSTLFAFQRLGGTPRGLPEELAKTAMKSVLEALDFLHTEANVTHCDLKLSNIMLRAEDEGIFTDYEKEETLTPSNGKVITGERTIYASRPFRRTRAHAYGLPVLCDFGEARIGAPNVYAEIQPEIYKSPEILMQFEWDHAADIWNVACVLWEMLEVEHLFSGCDSEDYTTIATI